MAKEKKYHGSWQYECRAVKVIFCIRMALWIAALVLTFHWVYVSFALYHQGIFDPHEYATILRPILYRDFLASVACIVVSFIFRHISDTIKEVKKQK